MPRRTVIPLLAAICIALLGAAPPSQARDGGGDDHDVRASAMCGRGASAALRVRAHDGSIRIEFTLRRGRAGERWRIVLVHERRVAWRGTLRTSRSSGSLRLRRSMPDFDGPDQVTARASGPHGLTCLASATLTG
jgi:hypothetical protein